MTRIASSRNCLILALSLLFPLLSSADDTKDYQVRERTVRYRSEKPKAGGPEAQAIAFVEMIIKRDFSNAKKNLLAKSISESDKREWEVFNIQQPTSHKLTKVRSWGILSEKDGKPFVELVYYRVEGSGMNLAIPMTKEDGVWKVAGFH